MYCASPRPPKAVKTTPFHSTNSEEIRSRKCPHFLSVTSSVLSSNGKLHYTRNLYHRIPYTSYTESHGVNTSGQVKEERGLLPLACTSNSERHRGSQPSGSCTSLVLFIPQMGLSGIIIPSMQGKQVRIMVRAICIPFIQKPYGYHSSISRATPREAQRGWVRDKDWFP